MSCTLTITIVSASGLKAVDAGGTSDPYVHLTGPNRIDEKTDPIKKTLTPEWNMKHAVSGVRPREEALGGHYDATPILFEVFDWNKIMKPVFLGRASVDMKTLKDGVAWSGSLSLTEKPKETKKGVSGEIQVVILYKVRNHSKLKLNLNIDGRRKSILIFIFIFN